MIIIKVVRVGYNSELTYAIITHSDYIRVSRHQKHVLVFFQKYNNLPDCVWDLCSYNQTVW